MAYSNNNVCDHLSLGLCRCTTTTTTIETKFLNSSNKKRKLKQQATDGATKKKTKKKRCNDDIGRNWGYSTKLMLYDDPWKVKKVLEKSDVDHSSRLLLDKILVEDLMLPVLSVNAAKEIQMKIWDIDTKSMHSLKLKRWGSGSYVLIDGWVRDFVARRGLQKGDEIGLHWDRYNRHFNFTVFQIFKPIKIDK
ncbi:B3 domain-containing protein At2g33720-like [Trifolium pratense]|uniref:B3 domain-containing protein At2g33720-like n=1 Tax=Trifolium pratense TaxID=57577 RepID=UPI001E6932DB|nr:B3 domain-containing protein At2g33720-like [Trifolium pratense]